MAKWSGNIGFSEQIEYEPGCWEDSITVKHYYGDIIRNINKLQNSGGINDNVVIANNFSIVADPYAKQNFQNMRYLEFFGTKWKVESVEVQFPRLVISVGGPWNGN